MKHLNLLRGTGVKKEIDLTDRAAPDLSVSPPRARRGYEQPVLRPLQRGRWRVLLGVTMAGDILALGVGLAGATLERFGQFITHKPSPYGLGLALWLPLMWLGFASAGLYDRQHTNNPAEELRRVFQGVAFGSALVVMVSFSIGWHLSRLWMLELLAIVLIGVALERRLIRKTVHGLRRRGRLRRKVLIVGADASGDMLANAIERAPWEGMDIVGFVAIDGEVPEPGRNVVGTISNLWELVATHGVVEVLVAPSVAATGHLTDVVANLDGVPVDLRLASALEGFLAQRLVVQPLGDRPLVAVQRAELKPAARIVKRALDLVMSVGALVVALPIIGLCAIAIRLDTKGPVFFRQRRVGMAGKEFMIWKLRSMVADAVEQKRLMEQQNEAEGLLFKIREDPRITRVGRFLRKMSLDELPQLFNVLTGHMSMVGPRPPLPEEVERYDARLGRRLLVKPGITGFWQVSGRSELSFEDYIRYDLLYVQNWSPALDVYLIVRTIPAILSRKGAY